MDAIKNETADMAKQGMEEVKKSGQDWLNYMEEHPIQTMFFGLVAYFAMKGIIK